MGEYDLEGDEEPDGHLDRKVQIVASHPKFDPKTFEYDLALLRFYEPVEFQPNVMPICIPEKDQDLIGETAWVTGWGRLYEGKPSYRQVTSAKQGFYASNKSVVFRCNILLMPIFLQFSN